MGELGKPLVRLELRRAELSDLVLGDDRLAGSAFVRALGVEAARATLKSGTARRFPAQVAVFSQGDEGDSLFVVLRGEARLFARVGSDTIELGRVEAGEVFGEAAVLEGGSVRNASAVAVGELDLGELPRTAVVGSMKGRPEVKAHLVKVMAERARALAEMSEFLRRW